MIETNSSSLYLLSLAVEYFELVTETRKPNEVIERGTPYMERWMLGRKMTVPTFVGRSRVTTGPASDPTPMQTEVENVYLHRYLRNDPEDMHCHPWPNVSIVLRGWYREEHLDRHGVIVRSYRRPGEIVIRAPEDRHAISEVEPGSMSLFITGPKVREWGFYPVGEFVHHTEYTAWRKRMGLLENADANPA